MLLVQSRVRSRRPRPTGDLSRPGVSAFLEATASTGAGNDIRRASSRADYLHNHTVPHRYQRRAPSDYNTALLPRPPVARLCAAAHHMHRHPLQHSLRLPLAVLTPAAPLRDPGEFLYNRDLRAAAVTPYRPASPQVAARRCTAAQDFLHRAGIRPNHDLGKPPSAATPRRGWCCPARSRHFITSRRCTTSIDHDILSSRWPGNSQHATHRCRSSRADSAPGPRRPPSNNTSPSRPAANCHESSPPSTAETTRFATSPPRYHA